VAAPDRGDLVWIDFDPQSGHEQAGHEQAGRRPALVLSPRLYHHVSPYAVVCPITQTVKGYPFEVVLPIGLGVSGAVLADRVKSIDRRSRRIEPAGTAPETIVQHVMAKILPLLFTDGATGNVTGNERDIREITVNGGQVLMESVGVGSARLVLRQRGVAQVNVPLTIERIESLEQVLGQARLLLAPTAGRV